MTDMHREAFTYPISLRVAAYRCKELAESASDEAIRVIAKNLDLAMDDAETVDFVRQAFNAAHVEIRTTYMQAAIRHLNARNEQRDSHE